MVATPALLALVLSAAPALSQTRGLQPGLYVSDAYSCSDFPPIASLAFDGHAFSYKGIKCSLRADSRPNGFIADCVDGGEIDPQRWTYKTLGPKSFSINGERFRYCSGIK